MSERNLILAFDPGKTSGVCCVSHLSGRAFTISASFEVQWQDRFKIFNLIYVNKASIKSIIIEEYRLFSNALTLKSQIGSDIPSAQVIGIIELSAAICKLEKCIVFQRPSDIHYTNPQTRKLEYTVSIDPDHKKKLHSGQHCIDAFLHAKLYILSNHRKLK